METWNQNRGTQGKQWIQHRIAHGLIGMIALIGLLLVRYAYVQLVRGADYTERLQAQVQTDAKMQSPRGKILDRDGRELAVTTVTKSIYIDPNNAADEDQDMIADGLAPLIGLTPKDIHDALAKGGGFVWLKHFLTQDEYEAARAFIHDHELTDCIGFNDEPKRFYPNDVLAANVIGFVGTEDKGLDGIEQAYDSLIKGETTEREIFTDRDDRPILDSVFQKGAYAGSRCKTVQLTIDSTMQFTVEQELDRAMAENNPAAVTCVVMDPKTGDVLAMASRPSYNPNQFYDYAPETWKNRAVSFIYEPGSTFKSVVAGAALQEKVVTPNQVFVDPGYVMVSGRRIQNWNGASFGTVTFTDVVKQSLNTGFAQVGLRLGAENLMKYAKEFGFGEPTGIGLPGEEAGILFNPDDMRASDIATTAIGQSIAVTPIQLVRAMAAIANDGVVLKPHIVKSIQNADGSTYMESQREEVGRALESATDKTLVGLLEQVVASGGGKKAAVKGYRIAGKTGTAQKIRPDGTGYMEGRYIASFCGFAPVEDPQIVVLVMIDDPGTGNFYGGQIAAPVAQRIFAQLLRYLRVEPSTDPFADMEKTQREKPRPEPKKYEGEIPTGMIVVPDFSGLSIRAAAQKAAAAGLQFESEGSGTAVSQSIPANTLVEQGTSVSVTFGQ